MSKSPNGRKDSAVWTFMCKVVEKKRKLCVDNEKAILYTHDKEFG